MPGSEGQARKIPKFTVTVEKAEEADHALQLAKTVRSYFGEGEKGQWECTTKHPEELGATVIKVTNDTLYFGRLEESYG